MTAFFCMRHGMTDWNRDHRIQGTTDIELNDHGREQARNWAESLVDGDFELIVTSTLKRAKETAEIINRTLALPITEDARLNELDWGEWTGMTEAELKKISKLVNQQKKKGFDFRPNGGESRNEQLQRACDVLLDLADEYPGKSVLVVAHYGILHCLAYALSGLDYMPGDSNPLKPYRLHRLECADMELAIGELNIEI